MGKPEWWQTRSVAVIVIVASALPLLWPDFPPLIDLPGHLGFYRILSEAGAMPLARHYAVHFAPIGNLGVEGLVMVLHPLLDVEAATRLVASLIPPLTVVAMLWVAWEAHGRVPPAAFFALPLAYALPFQLGFVNFSLAAALSLAGLALWIRLARTARSAVRILIFVPIAGVIWLCHSFGWAMLGLFVFGAETVIRRRQGRRALPSLLVAAASCLPMAWPQIAAMILGKPLVGDTGDWLDLMVKAQWIASLLRERWKPYDVACVILLTLVLWTVVRSKRLSFLPILGAPAVLGLAAFLFLPRLYGGGAYVDMRILPFAVALALLSVRTDDVVTARRLAGFGVAFFAMRTATSVVAFALFAWGQQAELAALPHIAVGSGVLSLVNEPSSASWDNPRLGQIAGFAIARNRVFSNAQWAIQGQQLLVPLHPAAAPFDRDPSQLIYAPGSDYVRTSFDDAIASFDRHSFQYVWTIGFPPGRAHAHDLQVVWSNRRSTLYRVMRTGPLVRGDAAANPSG